MKLLKSISLSSLFLLSAIAQAQNLPNVQEKSVVLSAPLTIDGKLETTQEFEAYNKSTGLYYTMMNDENNLYCIIKAESEVSIRKILIGGITLRVNPTAKKKQKGSLSVTYPVIARPTRPQGQRGQQGRMEGRPEIQSGAQDVKVLTAARKKQLESFKEIKIFGFEKISDSLIFVQNIHGIKVVVNYNEAGHLIYEFSAPLSLLTLNSLSPIEFTYNIKLNGLTLAAPPAGGGPEGFGGGPGGGGPGGPAGGGPGGFGGGSGARTSFDPSALQPSDFWGKYTLSKK